MDFVTFRPDPDRSPTTRPGDELEATGSENRRFQHRRSFRIRSDPPSTTSWFGLPSGPRKSRSRHSIPRKSRIERDVNAIEGPLIAIPSSGRWRRDISVPLYHAIASGLCHSDRHPVLPLAVDQREQERAALVAGLADGGDVDGRVVLDGALVLADAAADALDRVDVRPLELDASRPSGR